MEGKKETKKLAMTSTKQELLQAYNTLLKELETRQEGEPSRKRRSRRRRLGRLFKGRIRRRKVIKRSPRSNRRSVRPDRISDQLKAKNRFSNWRRSPPRKRNLRTLRDRKSAMSPAAIIEAKTRSGRNSPTRWERKESLREEIETTRGCMGERKSMTLPSRRRDAAEKKRRPEKRRSSIRLQARTADCCRPFCLREGETEKELKDKKEQMEQELSARRPPSPSKKRN